MIWVDASTALLSQSAAVDPRLSSVWYFRKVPSKRQTLALRARATHFVTVEQLLSLAEGALAMAKSRSAAMESITRVRGSWVLYKLEPVVLVAVPYQGTFRNCLTLFKKNQARKKRAM